MPTSAPTPPTFHILPATTPTHLAAAKALFTTYVASQNLDLAFQAIDHELASLPGKYALPHGVILLAYPNISPTASPLGVVALRALAGGEGRVCEMKRLYCAASSRGLGVGGALVEAVLGVAVELGYEEIRLDTLPSMGGARRLYARWGFVPIEAYHETPLEGTIFLSKVL